MRFLLFSLLLSALTNADVVKLVKAGLSSETVVAKISASDTSFDTSTDALVALANDGVPDTVIRAMVTSTPSAPPVATAAPAAPPVRRATTRRYSDIALHNPSGGRCDGAELRIDGKGIQASRCRTLDFDLTWPAIQSVCYEYGFRGTVMIRTATGEHRLSTTTPAQARKVVDHIRSNAPAVVVEECKH